MAEIEFLDDATASPDESEDLPVRPRHAPDVGVVLPVIAALLWLAAAALAVLAAFADRYTVSLGSGPSVFRYSVDDWGRITGGARGGGYQYEPRFGVPLCVCAGLFVLVAAVGLLPRAGTARIHRTAQLHRSASGVGLLTIGVLAGTLVAATLSTTSVLDDVRTSLETRGASGDPVNLELATTTGAVTPLGLAAVVAGLLAWLAAWRARRRRPAPAPAPE